MFQHKMPPRSHRPIVVRFMYRGKFKNIEVNPHAGFDALLEQVAAGWNIPVPIELEYIDTSNAETTILSRADDIPHVFALKYKWKVTVPKRASSPSRPGSTSPVLVPSPTRSPQLFSSSSLLSPHSTVNRMPTTLDRSSGADLRRDSVHDGTVPQNRDKWTELIPGDWKCKALVQTHPFFISYRQASESHVAKELYYKMKLALIDEQAVQLGGLHPSESSTDGLHPFLDVQCLSNGEQWGINFMAGLYNSGVIILLCSDAAMERMKHAQTSQDNVLLEWELSLQRLEEKKCDILPVLLSQRVPTVIDGKTRNIIVEFHSFDHTEFPDEYHCHPLSPRSRTIRQVIQEIFKFQGPKIDPESEIERIVTAAREIRSRRRFEQDSSTPVFLSPSKLAQLETWLTPLSAEMERERTRLLKVYLPGTRKWLLDEVVEFLSPNNTNTHRVMWLRGVAGVGKSVMAAVIARELQRQGLLGGQFFFKHDDEFRSSARNLILTLAFQLARFSAHFGNHLLSIQKDSPTVLSRPIPDMFSALVAAPLSQLLESKTLNQPIVLVVDALDECGRLNRRSEILQVFQELNRGLPANVKLIVTGRPESDIAEALSKLQVRSIEPTEEGNHNDQIIYAHHFLNTHGVEPSMIDVGAESLVRKSAGIFVWLITACRYLESGTSITLEEIMDLPEGSRLDGSMDAMYARTFGRLFDANVDNDTLFWVLATIVLAFEPMTATAIASLLHHKHAEEVGKALRQLEPILVLDTSSKRLRIFHKSVKDYFVDPSRCTDLRFQINVTKVHATISMWCIATLRKSLDFNMCNMRLRSVHKDYPDFKTRVKKMIPDHVRYAVKHFWEHCRDSVAKTANRPELAGDGGAREPPVSSVHVRNAPRRAQLERELCSLVSAHLHHLLEALSLLERLGLVIPAMVALESFFSQDLEIQAEAGIFSVETLLRDVMRVVQMFQVPLRESALQVYFTAIPFAPSESAFHRLYSVRGTPSGVKIPKVVNGGLASWSACVNVLEGHSSAVTSTAFSPDGSLIVSGSEDSTVQIWDAATGQELCGLDGHTKEVNSVSFSPDGCLVASGSSDQTVRIWYAASGQLVHDLHGHGDAISSVAFSFDGLRVISASWDKTVKIWNSATGRILRTMTGHTDVVNSAVFSPDSALAVSGSDDRTVRIWSTISGEEKMKLAGNRFLVKAVAFSPDGLRVLSGGADETVRVWDAATGQCLRQLKVHSDWIKAVSFSPDGSHIVSGSRDGTFLVVSAETGRTVHRFEGHTDSVNSVAFSPGGHFIVSGSSDSTVRIWDAATEHTVQAWHGHSQDVKAGAISPDGRLIVSGSNDKTLGLWDVTSGDELGRMTGHTGWINAVVFGPGGSLIASASDDTTVRVWVTATRQELQKLSGHYLAVKCAAFSPDGCLIASGSEDKTVRVWDVSTGEELLKLDGHSDGVNATTFSPDGRLVASAGRDRSVRVWDIAAGRLVHRLDGHSLPVNSVEFSPAPHPSNPARLPLLLASAADDRSVRIWSVASGQELHRLAAAAGPADGSAGAEPPPFRLATFGAPPATTGGGSSGAHRLLVRAVDAAGGERFWEAASGDELAPASVPARVSWQSTRFEESRLAGWLAAAHFAVPFWLPPELRGSCHLVAGARLFALGAKVALFVEAPVV